MDRHLLNLGGRTEHRHELERREKKFQIRFAMSMLIEGSHSSLKWLRVQDKPIGKERLNSQRHQIARENTASGCYPKCCPTGQLVHR